MKAKTINTLKEKDPLSFNEFKNELDIERAKDIIFLINKFHIKKNRKSK